MTCLTIAPAIVGLANDQIGGPAVISGRCDISQVADLPCRSSPPRRTRSVHPEARHDNPDGVVRRVIRIVGPEGSTATTIRSMSGRLS